MSEEQRRTGGGTRGERGGSGRQSSGREKGQTEDGKGKGRPHPPFTPDEARKEGRKGGKASHDDEH